MTERDRVLALLRGFFKGDEKKVELWMSTGNPLLGGLIPCEYMIMRPERLLKFVDTLLRENVRESTRWCPTCDGETTWFETASCAAYCTECREPKGPDAEWLQLLRRKS